jgi:integrase
MTSLRLTEKVISTAGLEAGQNDRIFFDDQITGFGFRIRRVKKWNGALSNKPPSRSWLFQYRIGGKTRRLVIGQSPAVKAGRAREIAAELHARVKLGHDPATEKRVRIERSAHTFGALVDKYLAAQRDEMRPRSYGQIVYHLQRHAAQLHPLPADGIDRQTIAARLNGIAAGSGAVTANRVRSTMSAMFTWGMKEGLVLANPIIATNKRAEKPRDRVLTGTELGLVWRSLGAGDYGTIVRLLLLTGQRMNEIAALRWSEIDFDRGVISLPSERTKNHRPHEIPMAKTVRSLLAARPKSNGREFVFGEGAGPFSGLSRRKEALDKEIAALNRGRPLPAWVHHDLRRSVATGMAELGIQPHIIEAVLNHVSGHQGGIAGIYNRAQYGPEKVQALARWDKHIGAIVQRGVSHVG